MSPPRYEYIYGINPAFEVSRAGKRPTLTAYLDRALTKNPRLTKLADLCDFKNIPLEGVDRSRLIELCTSFFCVAGGDRFDGNRWNDLHYTDAFKQKARYRQVKEAMVDA